ncbi:MAG TPA: hypothetical protein VH601_06170, partial [Bryobacteraceae bacterium]
MSEGYTVKKTLLTAVSKLACSACLTAAPVFIVGKPNFNNNHAVSPHLSSLVNFDDSATLSNVISSGGNFALPSGFYASAGIAPITDPSAAFGQPFSTQTAPDFLTNGNASTTGQAVINLPTTTQNAFNGYFAFDDSTADIRGISVVQSRDLSGSSPSGLAIDDLQVAPEPERLVLVAASALLVVLSLLR